MRMAAALDVGLFSATLPSLSASETRMHDASEVEFLKREVHDLERVIKSLHASRTDDRSALEQAEARATRALCAWRRARAATS